MAAPPKTAALPFAAEVGDLGRVTWPVLGVAIEWVERHCVIPDGFAKGQPYRLSDWQAWFYANHYRVKKGAKLTELPDGLLVPTGADAFHYRRSQIVLPQKAGKGPTTASQITLEGLGPALFDGWAQGGEVYDCAEHGCYCGWVYVYQPGEAMGTPWPTPLIQVTAFSEEQAGNVYDALRPMITEGPLSAISGVRVGEEFVKLPNGGRIDKVTSSQQSRLGQRVTFVPQDEALALDTPLPTPTGWTTMGEVQVGDALLGADGRPVLVEKATEIQEGRTCYRVTFSDGTSIVASDGHLWQTRIAASAAKSRVRTTGEMVADGRRFRVPAPAAYDLPDADLSLDPYVLGLWLGDGSTGKQEIAAHNDEADELVQHLATSGIDARIRRNPGGRAAAILLSSKTGYQGAGRPAWAKALSTMSCYRNKHIPQEYLRGSRAQREALLQGLMDADGHCTETGFCTFAGNARLAADVVLLLRTLGVHVQAVRHADPRSRAGEGWKVNFTPRGGLQPFRLARKARRARQAWVGSDWITITAIEPVESVPVRCVGVASDDHLFLAGEGGHVTHNTGIWTETNKMIKVADTQRRGAAGMGGRTVETTNAWDPAEQSVAQLTAQAALRTNDIFRLHPQGPPGLRYADKRQRREIHKHVYTGSFWVNLDSIEGEAFELLERDPAQAERFFGNRVVAGAGAWMDMDLWGKWARPDLVVPEGTEVCGGFDGSESDDWTAIRLETREGHRFTPRFGPDQKPAYWNPKEEGGSIPRGEVDAAMDEISRRYRLRRFYADPRDWESEIGNWALLYGEEVVFEWATYRIIDMHKALTQSLVDLKEGRNTHDGDSVAQMHLSNARKIPKPGDRYILGKPDQHRKIDIAMADTLAHRAAADLRAEGWVVKTTKKLTRVTGRARSN